MVNLNQDFSLRDQGVSNSLGTSELPRHRWYFIKEGFSPELVEQAAAQEGLEEADSILDPFSGSGTVPLAAATSGYKAIGFEINPFLRFLAVTKLANPPIKQLQKAAAAVEEGLHAPQKSDLEGVSTFTEGNRWDRWLFPLRVLRAFEGGHRAALKLTGTSRDVLRLALIGAAMDCCNATRDGKCLRYKSKWHECEADDGKLVEKFRERLRIITEDLELAPLVSRHASVLIGDARELLMNKKAKGFRLCVTSPPYLNSFDYSDIYRPELFLGRFVASNRSLMKIRLQTLRSHVQAKWKEPTQDEFGSTYRHCANQLRTPGLPLWDPRLPMMVQAYFEDMDAILRRLKGAAQKNSSLWLVVSTSAYAGVEIPVDLILADIGQNAGWHLREVGVLRYLRSSGQHMRRFDPEDRKPIPLRESVVVFDASKPRKIRAKIPCRPQRSD